MASTEIHYLSYDPDEIWAEIVAAYVNAGGDVLYPGDEKEMLLRSVLAVVTQNFAAVDTALRMDTLRYAVGDYLDIYGEKRNCARIAASAATATVEIIFKASGVVKTIPAGTALTADGERFYLLSDSIRQTGLVQTVSAEVVCQEAGSAGNGLLAGTQIHFAVSNSAVVSVYCTEDASGGNDKETDETYRSRIRLYGLVNITTGPAVQYRSNAMSVSSEILDAKALNLSAGNVGVYLLLDSEAESAAIIEAVEAKLNAQDARPLTDQVTVALAEEVEYTLNVEYSADEDSDVEDAISAAIEEYQVWQDQTIGRAFNPDKLIAYIYQAGATRVRFGDGSEYNGGTVEYTEIGEAVRCNGTINLAVIAT